MSSDHQPRTLLMARKTSSGVWSTVKAAVKLALPAAAAVMLGAPFSGACQHAPAPGARCHRWSATAFVRCGYVRSRARAREYVAVSGGRPDSGAFGEPRQLRATAAGLHQKPFHVLFHRADRKLQRSG